MITGQCKRLIMSDIINSTAFGFVFLLSLVAVPILVLVVWFFVNRASVRANEQIELLEALLEQQKQQTALLARLCVANEVDMPAEAAIEEPFDIGLPMQLVAKR